MRAAVLTRTDLLALSEVDLPRPGPGEVLVRVAACGVCGHDQADRAGLLHLPLPTVLGHEISGTVETTGPGAARFAPGDRVATRQFATCGRCAPCRSGDELRCPDKAFTYGGYAEFAVLRETSLLPVPAQVDLVAASVVACAVGTGLQALRERARLQPGETVLVTGAGGGLGLHGVQVAAALGGRVVALTGDLGKADRLHALGAEHVVRGGASGGAEILELTDGRGVDVVLDNVGHPEVFRQAFRALADRGRYVVTGQVGAEPLRVHPAFVFAKDAVITGSGSTSAATFAAAMDLVADGRVHPLVTRYPLAAVDRAFADLDARRVTGRAVLVPAPVAAPARGAVR